jgi:hypothetical protein
VLPAAPSTVHRCGGFIHQNTWWLVVNIWLMMMVNNDGYYMVNIWLMMVNDISGWWYTYPSEKYESQWEG